MEYKSGDIYGDVMLTGKSFVANRKRRVEFICVCGKISWAQFFNLTNGNTKSCGCRNINNITSHGFARHPLYKVFDNIKSRCTNPNHDSFHRYGGRGIGICEEWLKDYMSFHNWAISAGWEMGLTIDRIRNSGNYEPDNCRIATRKEQSANRDISKFYIAFGETKNASDWGKDERCSGVSVNTIVRRIEIKGWTPEKAITTPTLKRKK